MNDNKKIVIRGWIHLPTGRLVMDRVGKPLVMGTDTEKSYYLPSRDYVRDSEDFTDINLLNYYKNFMYHYPSKDRGICWGHACVALGYILNRLIDNGLLYRHADIAFRYRYTRPISVTLEQLVGKTKLDKITKGIKYL